MIESVNLSPIRPRFVQYSCQRDPRFMLQRAVDQHGIHLNERQHFNFLWPVILLDGLL